MSSIFCKATERGGWREVLESVIDLARWSPGQPVYQYVEGVEACTLGGKVAVDAVVPPDLAFEGRLFDGGADARWVCHDDGTFQAWVVREAAAGDDERDLTPFVECATRAYYLFGIGTGTPGQFTEARFPGTPFEYPIDRPAKWERAYIRVVEYYLAAPRWESIADAKAVEDALNRPMLFAHRFCDVGAGHGAEPWADARAGDDGARRERAGEPSATPRG